MSNRHELHAFNYINRSYADVRRQLLAEPLSIFRRATATASEASNAELHAKAGAFDISAPIEIEILGIEEPSPQRTNLEVAWKAAERAGLFPTMHATISMYPLTPTETQLELSGVYDPPMGVLGDVIDATAFRDIARSSVQRFVDDTASYLRVSVIVGPLTEG
jgi:hypothetical protein